jgi:hypothetical protein
LSILGKSSTTELYPQLSNGLFVVVVVVVQYWGLNSGPSP